MGFLNLLWDETLAGPTPDSGLGKLRKYNSLDSALRSPPPPIDIPISRSITVLRTNSPSGSSTPGSPFSPGTPREDFKRPNRKRGEAFERAEPRSPTVYDWIVISALDR